MATETPGKWEYKVILLPSAKENPADTARLKELVEVLNKHGAESWQPTDLTKHLPGGYLLLRRTLQATSFWGSPKPKVVAPPVATK